MSGLKTSTPDDALVAYLADARARVDAVLESWGVRAGEWWLAPVPAAMRYSLLSTGKRLRPTLVFAAAEAVGGGGAAERGGGLAAAVEGVHAYFPLHRDLPCMANDDLRRVRRAARLRGRRGARLPDLRRRARRDRDLRPAGQDGGEGRGGRKVDLRDPAGGGRRAGRSRAPGGTGGGPSAAGGVSFSYARGPGALHCYQTELKCASKGGTRNSERGTGGPDSAVTGPRSAFPLPRSAGVDWATPGRLWV